MFLFIYFILGQICSFEYQFVKSLKGASCDIFFCTNHVHLDTAAARSILTVPISDFTAATCFKAEHLKLSNSEPSDFHENPRNSLTHEDNRWPIRDLTLKMFRELITIVRHL